MTMQHTNGHDTADNWKARLSEGTEELTEAARERVMNARARALEARYAMQRKASESGEAAKDFVERHPLTVGLAIFAAGATLAAMLPRTRTEDRAFGARSDQLIADAERILAEEKAKAKAAAQAAVSEAADVAKTAVADAAEDLRNGVKDVAKSAEDAAADAKTRH